MKIGKLLNQNVDIFVIDEKTISLRNSLHGQELLRVTSDSPLSYWINAGGFMTKEDSEVKKTI